MISGLGQRQDLETQKSIGLSISGKIRSNDQKEIGKYIEQGLKDNCLQSEEQAKRKEEEYLHLTEETATSALVEFDCVSCCHVHSALATIPCLFNSIRYHQSTNHLSHMLCQQY
jgi:hypothetical protein